jgi:hypothetical protein
MKDKFSTEVKTMSREQQASELLREFYMEKQDENDCECDGSVVGCWYCRVAHLFEKQVA